jgi:hypothetical protein
MISEKIVEMSGVSGDTTVVVLRVIGMHAWSLAPFIEISKWYCVSRKPNLL